MDTQFLFQGPRISIFSRLCHSSCSCISVLKRILGCVSVQWPRISSPCWRSRYRSASCRLPRRRRGGGLLSAPSCSHSGLLHLRKQVHSKHKMMEWGRRREETAKAPASARQRHVRAQWEEMLTFLLLQCIKLSGIDNAAGDLQLDSFRFQPVKPG